MTGPSTLEGEFPRRHEPIGIRVYRPDRLTGLGHLYASWQKRWCSAEAFTIDGASYKRQLKGRCPCGPPAYDILSSYVHRLTARSLRATDAVVQNTFNPAAVRSEKYRAKSPAYVRSSRARFSRPYWKNKPQGSLPSLFWRQGLWTSGSHKKHPERRAC